MIDSNANGSALPDLPVSRLATDARFQHVYISFYTAMNVITLVSEKWNEEYRDAYNDLIVSTWAPVILYAVKLLYEFCWIRDESEIASILFENTSMVPFLYMCFHILLARSPDDPSARIVHVFGQELTGRELTLCTAAGVCLFIFGLSLRKFCDITQSQILYDHKFTMFAWSVLFLCTLSGGLPIPAAAQPFLVLAVLTIISGQVKAYCDFLHSQRTHQNEPTAGGGGAPHYTQLFSQNESAAGGGGAPHNTQMLGQGPQGSLGEGLIDVVDAIGVSDGGDGESIPIATPI